MSSEAVAPTRKRSASEMAGDSEPHDRTHVAVPANENEASDKENDIVANARPTHESGESSRAPRNTATTAARSSFGDRAASRAQEIIDLLSSDTEEEPAPPPAYQRHASRRPLLPQPTVAPPVLDNRRVFSNSQHQPFLQPRQLPPINSGINPIARDANGRPYPSPYQAYPSGQTILDYEAARARNNAPLAPVNEPRGITDRYTSVLEHDLAVTKGRLAKANYEKLAFENRSRVQARDIAALTSSVNALMMERDTLDNRVAKYEEENVVLKAKLAFVGPQRAALYEAMQDKMEEIEAFMMEHLEVGTEVQMDLFEIPRLRE